MTPFNEVGCDLDPANGATGLADGGIRSGLGSLYVLALVVK